VHVVHELATCCLSHPHRLLLKSRLHSIEILHIDVM
jgi:hypothetical protein